MASEIEAAAERYGRFMAMQMGATEHADYCMGPMCTDRDSLAQWAVALLAADRAERKERARPADDEWLYGKTRGVKVSLKWHSDTREVFLGGTSTGIKKTRGEWGDILRVLKGGAE